MKLNAGLCFTLFAVSVLLSACVSRRDISDSQSLRGGYSKGDTFVVKQDLGMLGNALTTDRGFTDRVQKGSSVKQIVKKGDRLRIIRVMFENHPENGVTIHPIAIIESGSLIGQEVDLWLVSKELREVRTDKDRFIIPAEDPSILDRTGIPMTTNTVAK